MKLSEVTCKLKLSHSTVSTVLKNKDRYLKDVKVARPMQSVGMENVVD
jgi:DNA-binding transcriptional regulator GbsR (MarR family)